MLCVQLITSPYYFHVYILENGEYTGAGRFCDTKDEMFCKYHNVSSIERRAMFFITFYLKGRKLCTTIQEAEDADTARMNAEFTLVCKGVEYDDFSVEEI